MVAIPLTSGAYQAASLIANAQRCVNMIPEKNPTETHPSFPTTHYVRPGLPLLSAPPAPASGRCLYVATNGNLYAIVGQTVYYIDPGFVWHALGNLFTARPTPVYMADNGATVAIVDGSPNGSQITLATDVFGAIVDPNFLGADRVDFIDTFLIFNVPGTNQWYCSLPGQLAFNALFIGVKTAWPDPILAVIAIEREVLVLGPYKGEIWYNAGTVPFPFQLLPGVIIEQGCAAKYSPAKMDAFVYWLSQSPEGARMVMRMGAQNVAQRISTHAIEKEFLSYQTVSDAVGSCYQEGGHSFYRLHFPSADVTWVFDQETEQWWEDLTIDANGAMHRALNMMTAYAYGKNVGLDWRNGNLYQMDFGTKTDNGQPIPWIRSFPHLANELHYLNLTEVTADVETGTRPGTGEDGFASPWSTAWSSGFGPLTRIEAPTVNLRLSRNGGALFGNNRPKANISSGRYRSMVRWRGNGLARDWVIELSSTAEMCGALNGAYVDPVAASA